MSLSATEGEQTMFSQINYVVYCPVCKDRKIINIHRNQRYAKCPKCKFCLVKGIKDGLFRQCSDNKNK